MATLPDYACVRSILYGCRRGFPDVIAILNKVIANMANMPPGTELDMNNVTLRIALDVTGLVGFAKDFQTCASFKDSGTDELFTIIQKSGSQGQPIHLMVQNPGSLSLIVCSA